MPLTLIQIGRLANALDEEWDLPKLSLFALDLGVALNNVAPDGSMKLRALKFINELNSQLPPRDREMLEELRRRNNARLAALADELLRPGYFPPEADAHEAIVLGTTAFVGRPELRRALREFTNPSPYSTRVLVVRGAEPGGKSYSWEFLRHLAISVAGVTPLRLRLRGTTYTPREFIDQIFGLLGLDRSRLSPLADDPQLARVDALINDLKGEMVRLTRPYWLVIDDINDRSVTPAVLDAAYAVAFSVEETHPDNLWLALLGYNPSITDSELRRIKQEDARFPDRAVVAGFLTQLAAHGPKPLSQAEAQQIADTLLERFPQLTKESMTSLTLLLEEAGEKVRMGARP